jgi:hypothetical protein
MAPNNLSECRHGLPAKVTRHFFLRPVQQSQDKRKTSRYGCYLAKCGIFRLMVKLRDKRSQLLRQRYSRKSLCISKRSMYDLDTCFCVLKWLHVPFKSKLNFCKTMLSKLVICGVFFIVRPNRFVRKHEGIHNRSYFLPPSGGR